MAPTLNDGIYRAGFLTEPTIDTLGHVNICMKCQDSGEQANLT